MGEQFRSSFEDKVSKKLWLIHIELWLRFTSGICFNRKVRCMLLYKYVHIKEKRRKAKQKVEQLSFFLCFAKQHSIFLLERNKAKRLFWHILGFLRFIVKVWIVKQSDESCMWMAPTSEFASSKAHTTLYADYTYVHTQMHTYAYHLKGDVKYNTFSITVVT